MRTARLLTLIFLLSGQAWGELKHQTVEYKHGNTVCEGYLVYDDALVGMRPGVIVVHEWMGLGDNAKMRADMLAKMGYSAFAIDMYGKGVRAKNHDEAGKLSGIYRNDRNLMRARAHAGLEVFKKDPHVNSTRIAAIGYCFGGTTALEMARAGEDLKGVASFHGGLDTPSPAKAGMLKAKIIAFQGADDKWTMSGLDAFREEMGRALADWQVVEYGGAVHSFTVKEAGNNPSTGMAYNEAADRRSWAALKEFLNEVFRW